MAAGKCGTALVSLRTAWLIALVATGTNARLAPAAALLVALAGGCATAGTGGQTGEEPGACWSEFTQLGPNDESPLGFSPQDSLNLAAGEHTATLHWIPGRRAYGPERGDGQLTVTITSLGSARFATRPGAQDVTELSTCGPSVLTDVAVELDTAGGAFHERFQGMLVAERAESATLTAALLGDHIGGSFAFDPAALTGQSLAEVTVNLAFSAGAFSGAVSAGIEQAGSGDVTSLENVPLACWGGAAVPGQTGCAE